MQRQNETGGIAYWPAINPDGMPAGVPGPEPVEYYGTARARPRESLYRALGTAIVRPFASPIAKVPS